MTDHIEFVKWTAITVFVFLLLFGQIIGSTNEVVREGVAAILSG